LSYLLEKFQAEYLSTFALFTSELVGTGILAFMIMATTDKHNAAPDPSIFPSLFCSSCSPLELLGAWRVCDLGSWDIVDAANLIGQHTPSTQPATSAVVYFFQWLATVE
jgi:hypothetical protein